MRLLFLVSHPIQYQALLLRLIAGRLDVDLMVVFEHLNTEISKADALWVHGWDNGLKRGALKYAKKIGAPVLMRGENTDAAMPHGWGLKGMAKRFYLAQIFVNCSSFLYIVSHNRRYNEKRGVEAARLFPVPYAANNDLIRTRIEDTSKS